MGSGISYCICQNRIFAQASLKICRNSGKGTEPEWNETFVFTVSGGVSELKLKIMDSDAGTSDDIVGEAT